MARKSGKPVYVRTEDVDSTIPKFILDYKIDEVNTALARELRRYAKAVVGAGVPNATTSLITASVSTLPANETATAVITVQLRRTNEINVFIGGDTVVLSTTRGTLSAVTDNNDGTYTAILTTGSIAGAAVVSGTVNGDAITSTASLTFTPAE
jgi:hypothetical protein